MHVARVKKDHDYAHELISQCVLADPANLEYTEGLFENLRAKFANKKPAWRGFGGHRAFKKALGHQDWIGALRLGLPLVAGNPWDVRTLDGMAQACAALHFNEVELVYLKQALDAAPKDAAVNRHCGRSLARLGQIDQAIACWHRVEMLVKNDREAADMISHLTELKMSGAAHRPSTTLDTAKEAKEDDPDQDARDNAAEVIGADAPTAPLSPRQQLETAIRKNPADLTNYLQLAKLLCEMELFEAAQGTLHKALENCAQQQTIHDALEEVNRQRAMAAELAAEAGRRAQLRKKRDTRTSLLAVALGLAVVVLFFQLFPQVWTALVEKVGGSVRATLILGNIGVLAVLIWLRMRPT